MGRALLPSCPNTACRRGRWRSRSPFGFPITNSMIVTWIVAVGLIVFAQLATRQMTQVPGGAQNFLEWIVESLYGLLESIIGRAPGRADVLVLRRPSSSSSSRPTGSASCPASARSAGATTPRTASSIDQPLFRGANADLNMTLAMALVFFASGSSGRSRKSASAGWPRSCSRPRATRRAPLKLLMIVVFFAAGCLEIVSILFRPVSLSFRLYGNVFAGENMLETMATMVPGLGGCCRSRSISWNCWWGWCRRWSSCC